MNNEVTVRSRDLAIDGLITAQTVTKTRMKRVTSLGVSTNMKKTKSCKMRWWSDK